MTDFAKLNALLEAGEKSAPADGSLPDYKALAGPATPAPAQEPDAEKPTLHEVFQSVAQLPNPDRSGQILKIANTTKQDPAFVAEHYDAFAKAASAPSKDEFDVVSRNFPITASALLDRDVMAQAYHDVPNLAAHEHANKQLTEAHDIASTIEAGLQNSIEGMGLRHGLPDVTLPADAPFGQRFTAGAVQFGADFPFMFIGGAAGAIAGSPLGPVGAGLAGLGGSFALPDAMRAALVKHYQDGDPEGAAGLLKQFFMPDTLKAGAKGFATGILTGVVGGAAVRPFTKVGLNGIPKISVLGNMVGKAAEVGTMTVAPAVMEGRASKLKGEDFAQGALLIALTHGVEAAGGYTLDRAFPKRVTDLIRLEVNREAANILDETSRESKLRKGNPELFAKLMNAHKPVLVPVGKWESLLQAAGKDPEKFSNDLGIAPAHNAAHLAGSDGRITIPQGVWLSAEMDPFRAKFLNDMTFDPNHLTPNEFKESDEAVAENLKRVMAESDVAIKADPKLQAQFDSLHQRASDLLNSNGFDENKAKDNANVIAAHYVVESIHRAQGETPEQLFEKEFPAVALKEFGVSMPLSPEEALEQAARTPKFKKWFGKSQVVDGKGKPLVVYHGSGVKISKFDYKFTDQGNDQLGSGFYFTTDESEANGYQTRTMPGETEKVGGSDEPTTHPVYLSIQHPLGADDSGDITAKQAREIIELAPDRDTGLSNWGDTSHEGEEAVLDKASQAYAMTNENVLGALNKLANDFFPSEIERFNKAVRNVLGYDGVKSRVDSQKTHYVAWFPEQIKSIDNMEPDARSRDIYSQASLFPQPPAPPETLHQDSPIVPYQEPKLADASYSKLLQTLDQKIQGKSATVEQVKALASNFKEDERKWTGFDEFMAGKSGKIDKAELIDFLKANRLQVEERVLGEKAAPEPENQLAPSEAPGETGPDPLTDFREWAAEHIPDVGPARTRDAFNEGPNNRWVRQWTAQGGVYPQSRAELLQRAERLIDERFESAVEEKLQDWSERDETGSHYATEVEKEDDRSAGELTDEELAARGAPPLAEGRPTKKVTVEVQARGGKKYKTKAFLTNVPGIVIHPSIDDADTGEFSKNRYTVSQGESGLSFGNNARDLPLEQAFRVVDEVAKLGLDWTKKYEDIRYDANQEDMGSRIISAVRSGWQGYENEVQPGEVQKKWQVHYEGSGAIDESEYFDTEEDAQQAADSNNENERDEAYREAEREIRRDIDRDDIVNEVYDELGIDADENTVRGEPGHKEFTWDKARYEGGNYSLAGAEPHSTREITFHAPQLEAYNPADTTHFADVTKGKDLGWTRVAIHKSDKGEPIMVANEFQNNRTQRGAAEGYKDDESNAFDEWRKGNDVLNNIYQEKAAIYDLLVEKITKRYWTALENGAKNLTTEWAYLENDPEYEAANEALESSRANYYASNNNKPGQGNVPDTPFKNNSYEFQFKRLLRWTVEQDYKKWQDEVRQGGTSTFEDFWKKNGIKKLAWTTGMMQAERNNRVDDVDKLVYDPVKQELSAYKAGRKVVDGAKMAPDAIAERLGGSPQAQEIAKRLLASEPVKAKENSAAGLNGAEKERLALMERHPEITRLNAGQTAELESLRAKQKGGEETEHAGMHVIHDEGGIKVASNAKFFTDLYDQKIPSFAKKFGKQWGGTVGEAMVKTGEQHGENHYDGAEPGLLKLEKVGRDIAGGNDEAAKVALRNVLEAMKGGKKFSEAVADGANQAEGSQYHRIAEYAGGRMTRDKESKFERVHALNITPEIARAAVNEGFPLFQGDNDPKGEYVPALNEIHLNPKTMDDSTLMHEFFHGALHHMFQFVKSGQANQDYLDHFKSMSDFLGIKDDQTTLTREQQEKGARAFERYLRGEDSQVGPTNAPSAELRGTFSMFRKWLTQVYRQIDGSPIAGELPPDVHAFFDRMLATDDQIEAAQRELGYRPSEIQDLPDTDPVEQKRIRTLQEQAHDKAFDILLKEQMAELRGENKDELAKKREEVTAPIFNELANEPVYRAYALFNPEGATERYTQKQIWEQAHGFLNGTLAHEDAAQFEAISEMSLFDDPKEMARQLLVTERAPAFEAELKKRVDAAMTPFANLKDTDAIKVRAMEVIHNTKSTELLALEQQILEGLQHKKEVSGEISKIRRASASAQAAQIKQQARDLLASKPADEAGAYRPYLTAERRAAVKVSQAIGKGDMAAAAKAKNEQMMNHALATEAIRNKAEILRAKKFLSKYAKRGADMLNMPEGFISKIDDLLSARGLKAPRDQGQEQTLQRIAQMMADKNETPSDIANATGYIRGDHGWQREALPNFIARINDENYVALNLPDSIMQRDSLHQANPSMTMGQLRDLKTAVKMLSYVGTQFDRWLSAFMKGDIKTNAGQMARDIQENIGAPHGQGPALGSFDMSHLQKAVDLIKAQPDGMIASKVNLLTLCEYLDLKKDANGHMQMDPDGAAKNNIYRPLREATNAEKTMRAEYAERLEALKEKHYPKGDSASFSDVLSRWQVPGEQFPRKLTRENLLIMLAYRGSETGMDRLRNGFGITDDQIRAQTDLLDARDHAFVSDLWKYIDTLWPQASALEMKVNGVEPKKVKAVPVETRHGTLEGGYYPLAYDPKKSLSAAKNALDRNALYKQYSTAAAHTEQGAMQERVKSLSRPVLLDFRGGLFNHLDDVIHDITHRAAIIDVQRFLNMPEARTALVNAIGQDGYKKITDDLKSSASTQATMLTDLEKGARWFRFSSTMATLGYRFKIFPRRISEDVVNAMREVGGMNTIGAASDFITNPSAMIEFNRANIPVLRDRAISRERDLSDLAKSWAGKESWFKRFAFMQDTIADQALTHPVANAVYKANLEKYGPERASQIAGEAVIRTFGGGDEIDRVGAQRGGELNKLVTIYYSFHSMMFNRAWLQGKIAGLEYNEGNYGKAVATVASTVATSVIIPAAIDILWSEMFRNTPEGQVNEEEKKKRMLARALETPFAMFPVGRMAAAAFIPLAVGERGQPFKISPAEDAFGRILETAGKGTQTMMSPDKHFTQKDMENAMASASTLIATPQILTTLTFNYIDWLNGDGGQATWRDLISRRTKK